MILNVSFLSETYFYIWNHFCFNCANSSSEYML